MDLSKLPKLSQTPPPPDQADASSEGGTTGAASPKVELYCRCGAAITPGTNFCSHCGANYYEAVGSRSPRSSRNGGHPAGGMWVEALVSIAMGLFLMLIAPNGIKYISAKVMGRPFTPYLHPTEQGVHVDYLRYQNTSTGVVTDYKYTDLFDAYWSDMAVTLFALALIVEGVVLALVRNRWAVLGCALLVVVVTIFNLWYLIASYSRINPITGTTYGLPILSALAVIIGVMTAGYQFRAYMELNGPRRR